MPIQKYRRQFQTNSLLDIELWAYRTGLTVEQGGLGRAKHFENCCREIWPEMTWYEWNTEQAEALCNEEVSGFTSGASSSKSDILARFALISWYADPVNTLIVVCSTSSIDARKRIWGGIVKFHRQAVAAKKAVGHLVETQAIIKLSEKTDPFAASDNSSISLVAAGSEDKNNALQRLQGFKNKHVILLLDELQDCSAEITSAAIWNLNANDRWEIHAAGNASSRFDAHGLLMQPLDGWNSINRTTHRWDIMVGGKKGVALHYDATSPDSPNMKRFSQGLPQLPFLRKAEDSLAARSHLGENNPVYLRQFAGFWSNSEGETNFIVTDQALASHFAYDKPEWASAPTSIAGIDPSYSSQGDRFIFFHILFGLMVNGVWGIDFHEAIPVRPILLPNETKDHGNIRVCKSLAEARGIAPRLVGMDSSAGTALLSIAHQMWSPDILGVEFGGSATDLPVSQFDKRIASDIYANATSELAYVFTEFLNAGQVRGIKPDHAKELTSRKFKLVAGGKIQIEKKADVKARLGFSPDLADSGHVGLRVIRERLNIQAGANTKAATQQSGDWKKLMKKRDVVSMSMHDTLRKAADSLLRY